MGVVTIHVYDDVSAQQSASRDYTCEIKLLLKHMRYFKPFLHGMPGENLEISVQCNLHTFEWLMAYVKAGITAVQPVMDCSNCIPILIACSYLKMTQLVREAVSFIATNILQLAAFGANIAALDGTLVTKIAKATSEEKLEQLLQQCQQAQLSHSPTSTSAAAAAAAISAKLGVHSGSVCSEACCEHVLLQKLYKHKLEALLKDHDTTLLRCSACQQLFSASSHQKLQCPALVGQATQRLKMLPLHQQDSTWRFQDYLQQQRQLAKQQAQMQAPLRRSHPQQQQQQQSTGPILWRDLYWLTWGHVTVLYCQQCHQHFPARQLCHCTAHPVAPVFTSEVDAGVYPCCGRPAWRPGLPLAYSQGCCAQEHQAAMQQQQQHKNTPGKQDKQALQQQQQQADDAQCGTTARALQLLQQFGRFILEPYKQPHLPPYEAAHLPSLAGPLHATVADTVYGGGGVGSSRPASRHAACGSQSLPLLVRMTNRALTAPSPRMGSSIGGAGTGGANSPLSDISPRSAYTSQAGIEAEAGTHPLSATAMTATVLPETKPPSGGHGTDGSSTGDRFDSSEEEDDLDDFDGELDYRSAHLRGFMEAVRAAAQSHNRSSSLLGSGGMSAGHMRAEVGVPRASTFSSTGAARWPMVSQSSPQQQQQAYSSSRALVRPGNRQYSQLAPTSTSSSRSSSKPAGDQLSSTAAMQTVTGRPEAMRAAAAPAHDVQANRVNRTLLLELMHEDDVYRMGLLMRKLDAVRLQPSPDDAATGFARRGSCIRNGTSQLMSERQVIHAVNGTLFEGMPYAHYIGSIKEDHSV